MRSFSLRSCSVNQLAEVSLGERLSLLGWALDSSVCGVLSPELANVYSDMMLTAGGRGQVLAHFRSCHPFVERMLFRPLMVKRRFAKAHLDQPGATGIRVEPECDCRDDASLLGQPQQQLFARVPTLPTHQQSPAIHPHALCHPPLRFSLAPLGVGLGFAAANVAPDLARWDGRPQAEGSAQTGKVSRRGSTAEGRIKQEKARVSAVVRWTDRGRPSR